MKKTIKWGAVVMFGMGVFSLLIAANRASTKAQTEDIIIGITNPEIQFVQNNKIVEVVKPWMDSTETSLNQRDILLQVEQKIGELEHVEKCDVFINNRKNLCIQITQKEPLFRVIHENGVSYYVDSNGIKFSLSPTFTANVPIVTGKIVYEVDSLGEQKGKAMNEILKLFSYLNQDEMAKALVTHVEIQPNGDLVFAPRTGYHLVNIGNAKNLEDKFHRLRIFYKEGLNKLGWEKYSEVNLKFDNQVIAKKKTE